MSTEGDSEILDSASEPHKQADNFLRLIFRPLAAYILLGFALLWAQTLDWLKQNEGLRTIFVHLGIALVGIPLWSWIRRLISVTEKLEEIFQREAQPKTMLHKALMHNLGGDQLSAHAADVASQCEDLVVSVSALLTKKTWASERYVQFVSSLIRGVVGDNALEFSKLVNDDRGERIFQVPKSAAELADQILEAQMKELGRGDLYYVISDLGSWHSRQLKRFFDETRNAIARGVTVKRIFNFMLQDKLPRDFVNILEMHLQATKDWKSEDGGSYQVKVLRTEDWPNVSAGCPDIDEANIKSSHYAHFGVFQHEAEMVRFRVEKSDLSKMMLCRHAGTISADSVSLFESLWRVSPDLSEILIKEIDRTFNSKGIEAPTADGEGSLLGL